MEILRSSVIREKDEHEEPPLRGTYGSEGFYFQQRRGHLNLRGIANINLEQIIRDVDIDVLQLHIENVVFCNLREEDLRYLTDPQVVKMFRISQLMLEYLLYSQDQLVANLNNLSKKYTAKKRALAKKRRELAELQESTKHLRNQVKAKKQNISTLEELLKETNRTREREFRKAQEKVGSTDPKSTSAIIKFFIANHSGLCVEFNERRDTLIEDLQEDVRRVFGSKNDKRTRRSQLSTLKLVHRGKILLKEASLASAEIVEGDTVLALFEVEEEVEEEIPAVSKGSAKEEKAPEAVDNKSSMLEILEFLGKQQESMRMFATEIKVGWENALQSVANQSKDRPSVVNYPQNPTDNSNILEQLGNKLGTFEADIREQLDAKLQHYQSLLIQQQQQQLAEQNQFGPVVMARRRYVLGDLESDNDEAMNDMMRRSNDRIAFLEQQLKNHANMTSEEVDRIRRSLEAMMNLLKERSQPESTPIVVEPPKKVTVATQQTPPPEKPAPRMFHIPEQVMAAEVQKPVPRPQAVVEQAPVIIVEKKVEEVIAPPPKVETPPPKEEPVSVPVEVTPPVEAGPQEVEIVFPFSLNPDLLQMRGEGFEMGYSLKVLENMEVDDLVFELRKGISQKLRVPLGRVELNLDGKRIILGMDIPPARIPLSPVRAKQFASEGSLTARLPNSKPLSNAQIDMMVPSWVKAQRDEDKKLADEEEKEEKLVADLKTQGIAVPKSRGKFTRKKRQWDEGFGDEDKERKGETPEEEGVISSTVYRRVRGSLEDVMGEVSDREGLTDEELNKQMSKLRSSLPDEMVPHVESYRSSVAGALAASVVDSGSESAAGEDFRSSFGRQSVNSSPARRSFSRTFSVGSRSEVGDSSDDGLLSRASRVARAVSKSLTLGGSKGGLLKLSRSLGFSKSKSKKGSDASEGEDESVTGPNTRRSLEQFEQEDSGSGSEIRWSRPRPLLDDTPMLASLNNFNFTSTDRLDQSVSFDVKEPDNQMRKQVGRSGDDFDDREGGKYDDRPMTSTGGRTQPDSLLYSPSVSTSNPRSRYSDDNDHEGRSAAAGNSAFVSTMDSDFGPMQRDMPSFDDDYYPSALDSPPAQAKGSGNPRRDASKAMDSVESYKRRLQQIKRRGDSRGDSMEDMADGKFQHSFEDTGDSFPDSMMISTGEQRSVGFHPDLSTTLDSEGNNLNVGKNDVRSSAVMRRADQYEKEAAATGESAVTDFTLEDDDGSLMMSPAGSRKHPGPQETGSKSHHSTLHSSHSDASSQGGSLFRTLDPGTPTGKGGTGEVDDDSLDLSESHS